MHKELADAILTVNKRAHPCPQNLSRIHTYLLKAFALRGCLRWEHFRKGLEDAEYFYTLARLIDKHRLSAATNGCSGVVLAGQEALGRIRSVVWGWTPEVKQMLTAEPFPQTKESAPYTTNATLVDAVLRDVAGAIEGIVSAC